MFALINDHNIYYEIIGEGEPLFLLPGGPGGDHNIYKKTHLPLAEHNQLIFFDPYGCGQSSTGEMADYTIDNYVKDVESLRQFLKFDKMNLLGKSYGGMAAQAYVAKYPQAVNKLLLVATATSFHFIEDARRNLEARGNPVQIAAGNKLLAGDFSSQAELDETMLKLRTFYSDAQKGLSEEELKKAGAKLAYQPLVNGFTTFLRDWNYEDKLPLIQQETLIIGGDHDWICDPKYSRLMHEKIPHSSLLMLNAGHSVDLDQTEMYLKAVDKFLIND